MREKSPRLPKCANAGTPADPVGSAGYRLNRVSPRLVRSASLRTSSLKSAPRQGHSKGRLLLMTKRVQPNAGHGDSYTVTLTSLMLSCSLGKQSFEMGSDRRDFRGSGAAVSGIGLRHFVASRVGDWVTELVWCVALMGGRWEICC